MNLKQAFSITVLLELFLISNLFFLTFDILIAHATNGFKHGTEYIPLVFSFCSSVVLSILLFYKNKFPRFSEWSNILVGLMSIGIGAIGFYYHLESNFLLQPTLKNLVYTAPFVAPLAYSGIGILLILNTRYRPESPIWVYGTLLCGYLGFLGNFVLSLCDHAQNGFFHSSEWIPVVSAALMVGGLTPLIFSAPTKTLLRICEGLLVVQIFVGSLGFILHFVSNIPESIGSSGMALAESFIFGSPIFAPLLYINLAVLLVFPIFGLEKRCGGFIKIQS